MRLPVDAARTPTPWDVHFWLADKESATRGVGERVGRAGGATVWRDGDEVTVLGPGDRAGAVNLGRREGWVSASPGDEDGPWSVVHGHLRLLWALALGRRGLHSLHASGVVVGDGAIVIIGRSGAGKSTLAASLARAGARFLSDDSVFVDGATGHLLGMGDTCRLLDPASSGHPVTGKDPDGKMTVAAGMPTTGPAQPRVILFIGSVQEPSIRCERLSAADTMTRLLRSSGTGIDPASGIRRLNALGRLAESCPAFAVSRGPEPPSPAMLEEWIEMASAC